MERLAKEARREAVITGCDTLIVDTAGRNQIAADLMEEIVLARRLLSAAMKPDGVNIGFNLGASAGGSIAHLHAHVVPRWNGDNNFMPVVAETRVLPQSLEATWVRLAASVGQLAPNS